MRASLPPLSLFSGLKDPLTVLSELAKEERQGVLQRLWIDDFIPALQEGRKEHRMGRVLRLGIPASLREEVWMLLLGNELNITEQLYQINVQRARALLEEFESSAVDHDEEKVMENRIEPALVKSKEQSIRLLEEDLPRTFPQYQFFHGEESPLGGALRDLLYAYVCYRPDIGYVQGMSYLAAIILLFVSAPDQAFVAFSNLLNNELYFNLFRMDHEQLKRYFAVFAELLAKEMPRVYAHFREIDIEPSMYLYEWMMTIFGRSLDLDIAARIWDSFLFEGHSFIFRSALEEALIKCKEDLFTRGDFEDCLVQLNHPADITEDLLFTSMEYIHFKNKDFEKLLDKHDLAF